jgi:hypothetical protein
MSYENVEEKVREPSDLPPPLAMRKDSLGIRKSRLAVSLSDNCLQVRMTCAEEQGEEICLWECAHEAKGCMLDLQGTSSVAVVGSAVKVPRRGNHSSPSPLEHMDGQLTGRGLYQQNADEKGPGVQAPVSAVLRAEIWQVTSLDVA